MSITRVDIIAKKGTEESLAPDFYSHCNGVWVEERDDGVAIKCYPAEPEAFLSYIRRSLSFSMEVTVVEEEEKDYVSIVRSHFTPVRIGDVTILPPWRKTRRAGKVIIIEPGMAFGTGRHESTKLMIKMMAAVNFNGVHVLDLGSGSGVLALYASMLGARVVAVDHDPLATEAAKKGCELNRCDMAIVCSGAEAIRGTFDVVLANLDFDTFSRHGSAITARIKEGGYLIISGIEEQYEKKVVPLFRPLTLVRRTRMKDWRGYVFTRDEGITKKAPRAVELQSLNGIS